MEDVAGCAKGWMSQGGCGNSSAHDQEIFAYGGSDRSAEGLRKSFADGVKSGASPPAGIGPELVRPLH
jgi:hypothetical protein